MISSELQNAIETHNSVFQINWVNDVDNIATVYTTKDFVAVFAALILGNWNKADWEYVGDHLLIWLK